MSGSGSSSGDEFDSDSDEWGDVVGGDGETDDSFDGGDGVGDAPAAQTFGEAWQTCWWGTARAPLDDRRHEGTRYVVLGGRDEILGAMRSRMRALATRLVEEAGVRLEPSAALALLQFNSWNVQRIIDRFWSDEFGEGGILAHYGCAAVKRTTDAALDECPVCMEDVDSVFHLGDARDAMCRACWLRSLRDVALATEGLSVATKRCAHSGIVIPSDVWQDTLSAAEYGTYLTRLTEQFVSACDEVLWCLSNTRGGCGCGAAIELRSSGARGSASARRSDEAKATSRYTGVKCGCGTTFCFNCAKSASTYSALGDSDCNHGCHEPASCDHIATWLGSGGSSSSSGGGDGGASSSGSASSSALRAGVDRSKSLGSEELTAAFFKAYTKKCPLCATPIFQDRGCLEITCAQCTCKFCWECLMTGEEWTQTHFSASSGSWYKCPTKERRMKSVGMSVSDVEEREARRQMAVYKEMNELHELFREHARDTHTDLLRQALRLKGGAESSSRGVGSALRYVEDAANEVTNVYRALQWTPVYMFVEFQKVGGDRQRERGLITRRGEELAKKATQLKLDLISDAVDIDGPHVDLAVLRIEWEEEEAKRAAAAADDDDDTPYIPAIPPVLEECRCMTCWRKSIIEQTIALSRRKENHIAGALSTRFDNITDHAQIEQEQRCWDAAQVWMAAQVPPITLAQLGVGLAAAATSGGGGSSSSSSSSSSVRSVDEPTSKRARPTLALESESGDAEVAMGLTRLRALHPGRPWEVALESEASGKRGGGHPVWWWKDMRGRFVQYPMEAQDVVEATFQRLTGSKSTRLLSLGGEMLSASGMSEPEAHAECEYTTTSGRKLLIEICADGSGSHTANGSNASRFGKRKVKRTVEVSPDWTCDMCSLQNRGGTTCISCQWHTERGMVDPTAPTSPR